MLSDFHCKENDGTIGPVQLIQIFLVISPDIRRIRSLANTGVWFFFTEKHFVFWIWTEDHSFKYNYTKTRQNSTSKIETFIMKHTLYYENILFLSRDVKLYMIIDWHLNNILVNSSFYILDTTGVRVTRLVGGNMFNKIKYWTLIKFHYIQGKSP